MCTFPDYGKVARYFYGKVNYVRNGMPTMCYVGMLLSITKKNVVYVRLSNINNITL